MISDTRCNVVCLFNICMYSFIKPFKLVPNVYNLWDVLDEDAFPFVSVESHTIQVHWIIQGYYVILREMEKNIFLINVYCIYSHDLIYPYHDSFICLFFSNSLCFIHQRFVSDPVLVLFGWLILLPSVFPQVQGPLNLQSITALKYSLATVVIRILQRTVLYFRKLSFTFI